MKMVLWEILSKIYMFLLKHEHCLSSCLVLQESYAVGATYYFQRTCLYINFTKDKELKYPLRMLTSD